MNYLKFIQKRLKIVDKTGTEIPFIPNQVQEQYLTKDATGRDFILKSRQMGFSSIILAKFTADFILTKNSQSVVVADNADNAIALLERVKYFVKSYEDITGVKIPLKYNSRYELHNEYQNSKYTIGTAENTEFGRSRTITNLHLSEAAFYPHLNKLLAGALQAVVPDGWAVIETTACGFNEAKDYWDESVLGQTGFKPLFYGASSFYNKDFLGQKQRELREYYLQEYPEESLDAFLLSGGSFFTTNVLKMYYEKIREPLTYELVY